MTDSCSIAAQQRLAPGDLVPLPFAGLVALTGFEILVAVLQAYIFTILTAVYIDESLHPEH